MPTNSTTPNSLKNFGWRLPTCGATIVPGSQAGRSVAGGGPLRHPQDVPVGGFFAPVERAPVHRVAVLQRGGLDPFVVLGMSVDER